MNAITISLKNTILIICLMPCGVVYGQNRIKMIESETQKTINQLFEKIDNQNNKVIDEFYKIDESELKNSLDNLSTTTTLFYEQAANDYNISVENDTIFVQSLAYSQKILDGLVSDLNSINDAKTIIDAVQKDYNIKMSAFDANYRFITAVEVSVFTIKNNKKIDGYDVKCNYLWDFTLKSAKFIFNNQTNNATRKLSPGYYTIWIEKNGKIIQKKDKVEIGNLQKDKESIIFNL